MKSKKGAELETSTIVLFVLALLVLAIGVYIIYTKILKPSETTASFLTCESRGGDPAVSSLATCRLNPECKLCVDLPNKESKGEAKPCCIKDLLLK